MKIEDYPKPEIGMEIFVVGYGYRKSYLETIKKVGRKWVTLANGIRFDIKTWKLDGNGICYPSEHEYSKRQELERAWDNLRNYFMFKYSRNPDVTLEQIKQAAELLKINLGEMK